MKRYNDYTVLFFALGAAIVLVYFVPVALNRVLFFIYIYLFYKSDKDYIWIAFIFIVHEYPGGLFSGEEGKDIMRLPLYTILPGISFTFQQIFTLTALFKSIKRNAISNLYPFIENNLFKLLIFFVFLILIGIGLGVTFNIIIFLINVIINLTLFFSIYRLFANETDYINFFRVLIPFGFIVFLLQLYAASAGQPLINYFKPGTINLLYRPETGGVRPIESSFLTSLLFFFSMYFILWKKKYFNKNLLIVLNIITFFSIILGATRSWFIMFVMFYLLIVMFITGKMRNTVMRYGIVGIIAILFIFSSDLFVNQLNISIKRLSTLELVAEGDITGGGTVQRFDIRAPRLIETFYNESTIIFGAGFSELYALKKDPHVGYHNLLFNTGIFGIILFASFLGSLIMNTFGINRKLKSNNPYKGVLKIFPATIISMLFLNVGVQVFGYDVSYSNLFLITYILYFLNNQINCAVKWEEENG